MNDSSKLGFNRGVLKKGQHYIVGSIHDSKELNLVGKMYCSFDPRRFRMADKTNITKI